MAKFKLLLSSLLLSSSIYAGGYVIPNTPSIFTEKEINSYFISVSGGISQFKLNSSVTSLNSANFNPKSLDDTANVYSIDLGYYINKNYFLTLSFRQNMLDLADIYSISYGINYQFSDTFLKPYIGVFGGNGLLKWSSEPYKSIVSSSLDSKCTTYGAKVGLVYDISDNFSILTEYQYEVINYDLQLLGGTSYIQHKDNNSFTIGIKYAF